MRVWRGWEDRTHLFDGIKAQGALRSTSVPLRRGQPIGRCGELNSGFQDGT